MEMGLDAWGLVLVAKISACGLMGMSFNACRMVLVAEIIARF